MSPPTPLPPLELPHAEDVKLLPLHTVHSETGTLRAMTSHAEVPFVIARIFLVHAVPDGTVRGRHAHRVCQQQLLCVSGAVRIDIDDGTRRQTHRLVPDGMSLLVPAGLWMEQRYETADSMLLVLADTPYDESGYIRNFEAYLRFRERSRVRAAG